jgi:hypothetical protein
VPWWNSSALKVRSAGVVKAHHLAIQNRGLHIEDAAQGRGQ